MSSEVRVRFAPSPTGLLHIGGLRTALYNYLFAKHHNGTFVLRIEDTDQARFVEGAEEDIIKSLDWTGLHFDEGPGIEGEFGPYKQSERSELYQKYAQQLIDSGYAYYAFDTQEDIQDMRERLRKSGNPSPKYDAITRMSMKNSSTLSSEEVTKRLESGEEYVVRLKVPRRETVRFEDEIRGFVSFQTQGLDDQVLIKSDGLPTYHLANVVDDHHMKITHVIRGEEWLSSAPKHILLYQYLGWEAPKMAHLPLIMSPNGGKLSKRNAEKEGIPVNVKQYVEDHYEPEALINFLAFLGWSPGTNEELFTLDELASSFSLDRVSKSGAIFNFKKLMWYNAHYLREKATEDTAHRLLPLLTQNGIECSNSEFLQRVVELMNERAQQLTDIVNDGIYFFKAPEKYDEKSIAKAWKAETPELVHSFLMAIESLENPDRMDFKKVVTDLLEAKSLGFGKLASPLRVLISGIGYGSDLFSIMELIGKEETINRIKIGLERLV